MTSRKLTDLHPDLQKAFTKAVADWNRLYPTAPKPILTCTFRDGAEQNRLYAQGRTTPGPVVTWVRAGGSAHNYLPALAFDVAFVLGKKTDWNNRWFDLFAPLVLAYGGIGWGGNWTKKRDRPHFELAHWEKHKPVV